MKKWKILTRTLKKIKPGVAAVKIVNNMLCKQMVSVERQSWKKCPVLST